MKKLHFNRTESTEWNKFVKRCKLVYRMLIADRFILIEIVENEETQTQNITTVGFDCSLAEINTTCKEVYVRTIDVVYKDVSFATKLIKQLNGDNHLALSN